MDSCSRAVEAQPPATTVGGDVDLPTLSLVQEIEAEIKAGRVEMPVLPAVALRVREIIAREGSIKEIASVVERDPVLAAALLRYANSVIYGGLRTVVDLGQAITRLGLMAVEQTILALSARVAFEPTDLQHAGILKKLWAHALATALAARRLAARTVQPDLAFLGGLLHDIGKVVILRCTVVLAKRDPSRYQFLQPALIEFFDSLHCTVGDSFLASWNIPIEIRTAVRRHHDARFVGAADMLPAIVSFADLVATRLGTGLRPDPGVRLLDSPAASLLRLDDVKVAALLVDIEDDIERLGKTS